MSFISMVTCLNGMYMSKEKSETQKTPKGHEIPVPKKGEFETALDKVAKPEKKSPTRRPKKD